MVINAQDSHLQKILRDDALAMVLKLLHIPLRIDEATAQITGTGQSEIQGCGSRQSS